MDNDGPPSLERVQRWKLAKANWDQFQHLCSTRLQQSAIADADDPMSSKMQSKSATGPLRGSNVNQPRVTSMPIALLGLRLAEISDTVRKHLGEIMSPR